MKLKILPPPLNEYDEADDLDAWTLWFKSIDFIKWEYKDCVEPKETYLIEYGHRGVLFRENNSSKYSWAYKIESGFKKP